MNTNLIGQKIGFSKNSKVWFPKGAAPTLKSDELKGRHTAPIFAVKCSKLGIYPLHSYPEVLWKLAATQGTSVCVRACFVHFGQLNKDNLSFWTKHDLAHWGVNDSELSE